MWRVAWSMMADHGSRQGGPCPARAVGHRGNAPDMYVNKIAKAPQAARLHARQVRCLQCHGGANMKIPSHYVRIPFDMGAAKHSPVAISHHGPSARAGEDRRWRYRFGEGIGHSVIPATKAALETYVGSVPSARRFNRLSRRACGRNATALLRKLRSTLDSYSTTVNQLSSFQPRP
jgi:hypothetical protein